MNRKVLPHEVEGAKDKIKSILRGNSKIEDLDDEALRVLALLCEKELLNRRSPYLRPGVGHLLQRSGI